MVLFQHGQHDRRHLGQFTRQTKPQHFTNARRTEIHTHDSGAGKLCTTWNATLLSLSEFLTEYPTKDQYPLSSAVRVHPALHE